MTRNRGAAADAPLFDISTPGIKDGPIRKGTKRAVNARVRAKELDRDQDADFISLLLETAAAIDRMYGHGGMKPAAGMQVAALVREFREMRTVLFATKDTDPLQELLEKMEQAEREGAASGKAEAPHPA